MTASAEQAAAALRAAFVSSATTPSESVPIVMEVLR